MADYPEQQPTAALEFDGEIQNSGFGLEDESKSQVLLLDQTFIEPPQTNELNCKQNKIEPNCSKVKSQFLESGLISENEKDENLVQSGHPQHRKMELANETVDAMDAGENLADEKVGVEIRVQSSMSSVTDINEQCANLEDLEKCLGKDKNEPNVGAILEESESRSIEENDDACGQQDALQPETIVDLASKADTKEKAAEREKAGAQLAETLVGKRKTNEAQTVFPDSLYEPFARKNLKCKTSVQFTALPAAQQPPVEKTEKSLSRRTTSAMNPKLIDNEFGSSSPTPVLKYFSRQNSNPTSMQTSTFDPIKITSEDPKLAELLKSDERTPNQDQLSPVELLNTSPTENASTKEVDEIAREKSALLHEIDGNIENIEPELDAQEEEPEDEYVKHGENDDHGSSVAPNEQPRTHQITVPIKLPKSHTESTPTVTNHFYDGSYVNDSPTNGRASKSTILPALKSLNGKKGKSFSVDETTGTGGAGIILPNIEPPKAGMEGPRGELRKQHSLHNIGGSNSTKQKAGGSHRQTSNNESSHDKPERPEISTIRGPHPKWLVNQNHLQQKPTSILSESLPIEEKLLKRQRFMMRSKRFQDPLNSRLSLVPGLTEKENSSFHEIRQKLGQIENKIEHIIKHSSHLSRSIDRPNSDSFVETNRPLLIPRNQVFLQQASMLNGGHGTFTHFFETCKSVRDGDSSFGEGYEDDKKLNVVNLVLEGENPHSAAERIKNYPFSVAMEPGSVLHQIQQHHHLHQQHRSLAAGNQHPTPVTPGKIPLLSRVQQDFGAKSYISSTSHPLHSRQPTQTLGKTSTPSAPSLSTNLPKVRRKEHTHLRNKSNKNSQKTKTGLTVEKNDNSADRTSETSSEGKRTIDETVVLRAHGEIELSPW